MKNILCGIDILINSDEARKLIKGNIAYLGHQASVSSKLDNGLDIMVSLFGKRLNKAFGPQHGFSTAAQDNMIETDHSIHSKYGIPIYSLYSETRIPTDRMLEGIDSLIVDLQDVGTRVYTYIWTLYHVMEAVSNKEIHVIVLDRPNPVNGVSIQGNFPEEDHFSFVCRSKIPMRHGMTIGEMALWFKSYHFPDVDLSIVSMYGWERDMYWQDTGLIWVNPSPNLPTPEGCIAYPGTVLFEGTNLSEGRGTTRSLEIIGHPDIDPNIWRNDLDTFLSKNGVAGFALRPVYFEPVFQKFQGISCGGFQIHTIEKNEFNPWKLGQLLISFLYRKLDIKGFWNTDAYEYEHKGLAIDWINGTDKIRGLIEGEISGNDLDKLEEEGLEEFMALREEILLY